MDEIEFIGTGYHAVEMQVASECTSQYKTWQKYEDKLKELDASESPTTLDMIDKVIALAKHGGLGAAEIAKAEAVKAKVR